jgi:uncharacterized coiled-coil protein SlyX
MSYDDALGEYIKQLEVEITQANAKVLDLSVHLAEAHRKIALLEEQVRHYYL